MRISVLIENTASRPAFLAEHGLSLLIETGGQRILFDMGQSGSFAENARRLGFDLDCVDLAVLSHGHYDHGGGLGTFLELNGHAPVYVRREAFLPHWHGKKHIGLDPKFCGHPRLVLTDGNLQISEGLALVQSRSHALDPGLQMEAGGMLVPDDFAHEQNLLIEENGRKFLFSGCSHRGILNIAEQFRPDVLVGGFHFRDVTDRKKLEDAARALLAFPAQYCTCHCTGTDQFRVMKHIMGGRLQYLSTGDILNL